MAKRRAESLVCHAPWKRFLPDPQSLLLRAPGGCLEPGSPGRAALRSSGPGQKRKREEEAEASLAQQPRRRSCPLGQPGDAASAEGRRRQQQQQQEKLRVAGPRREPQGGGDGSGDRGEPTSQEREEEIWQYNSFQYWRAPLPVVDLSDILDLEGENMSEARAHCGLEVVDTEMET